VIVSTCDHGPRQKYGKTKSGAVRYRCKLCGKTFTESTHLLGGMRIGLDRAAQIIELLCEGMSVRATARVTDTAPQTILDLLKLVGERCESFMAEKIRDVPADEIQIDEIWQYIFCKTKTAMLKKYVGGCGDSWTFTAIERHTKLLVAWHHGHRTSRDTHTFCRKLHRATRGRFHLSSDAYAPYEEAVTFQLGSRKVDYGQLVKVFGEPEKEERRKYSPARIISATKRPMLGKPDDDKICTSHCERMNGTIRLFVKRMSRLTYAFSKRWDNHRCALAVFFAHYNFCRAHKSLKGHTPAMAHGLALHVWSVRDLLLRVE
jgi:transposase-like protein/IS1 family transposase